MIQRDIIIFGYNEYALEIAKSIQPEYRSVHIYTLNEQNRALVEQAGFKCSIFDLSDNWHEISDNYNLSELLIFCGIEDDAQNIFVTISLRASFESVRIIALAASDETSNKLKMAGANKIIPVAQTTANIIVEHLESPITTNVMNDILYGNGDLKTTQVKVAESSEYIGQYLYSIKWNEKFGVIVLAVVDEKMTSSFLFTSKGQKHKLQAGDLLVIIGYEKDIQVFKHAVGGEALEK